MKSSIFKKKIWLEYESKKKERKVSPKSQIDNRFFFLKNNKTNPLPLMHLRHCNIFFLIIMNIQ